MVQYLGVDVGDAGLKRQLVKLNLLAQGVQPGGKRKYLCIRKQSARLVLGAAVLQDADSLANEEDAGRHGLWDVWWHTRCSNLGAACTALPTSWPT